ncbi:hypothetical protein AB2B38_004565 [Balneola sp. MJW-20]|uniref:hypothetical protein n=1 Tax=Gracilimonas aurantiaca TaxID=3234185 RepID=UPI0034653559
MKPYTKILNDRDKILFEKALKFYFFSRQQDANKLNSELRERFRYAGQVAYSLIITYLKEDRLRIEYMDFLNDEIKTLRSVDADLLKQLMIQPDEIDEIEFNQSVSIKVHDMDEGADVVITYDPEAGMIRATYK